MAPRLIAGDMRLPAWAAGAVRILGPVSLDENEAAEQLVRELARILASTSRLSASIFLLIRN